MATRGPKRSPKPKNRPPPGVKTGNGRMAPRFNPYIKLIHRFYEPLILLDTLGPTRAPHDRDPREPSTIEERRRRLLRNLSYLCDYSKGGDSTAAIGLQETQSAYVFWIASNSASSDDDKVTTFLKDTLDELRKIVQDPNATAHAQREFTRRCIRFAKARIDKEHKQLRKKITECQQYLDLAEDAEGQLACLR